LALFASWRFNSILIETAKTQRTPRKDNEVVKFSILFLSNLLNKNPEFPC